MWIGLYHAINEANNVYVGPNLGRSGKMKLPIISEYIIHGRYKDFVICEEKKINRGNDPLEIYCWETFLWPESAMALILMTLATFRYSCKHHPDKCFQL